MSQNDDAAAAAAATVVVVVNNSVNPRNPQEDNEAKKSPPKAETEPETPKARIANNPKSESKVEPKNERLTKAAPLKDQQQKTEAKASNPQKDEVESKNPKNLAKTDKEQKAAETQTASRKSTARPAVILLDENVSEARNSSESPSELTFGFEVNEQVSLYFHHSYVYYLFSKYIRWRRPFCMIIKMNKKYVKIIMQNK